MPAVETTLIPLGFKAPDFVLPDTISGKDLRLQDIKGSRATVIMFICNHCPYVIHIREELVKMAREYIPKGVAFIAISSNDVENYPDDSPGKMKELGLSLGFPFPYLYDESQEVAKSYFAACTPDFSIFDKDLLCIYRGQLDESRPKNDKPVTGKDIRAALDAVINGNEVNSHQIPSIGCSIKWKSEVG
jgi:thiol-disulfide isomerase/thioredoxin